MRFYDHTTVSQKNPIIPWTWTTIVHISKVSATWKPSWNPSPNPSLPPGWPLKWHLLGSPRYSKWGDLCLITATSTGRLPQLPRKREGQVVDRIYSDFFLAKMWMHHLSTIHVDEWDPYVEQKEIHPCLVNLVSTRKKHKIHPSSFIDPCLHLLKTWNEKRL